MEKEQNYSWIQKGSNFYKVDNSGNMIFTTKTPEDMTGVYVAERATEEMVDDPTTAQTYYKVYNKDPKKQKGRITLQGRSDRNKAIKTLYNNDELKTQWFGEDVANYNRAKFRRYIKSDDGRRALGGFNKERTININGEKTTRDPIGRRYDNEEHANLANDILNPERKTIDFSKEQIGNINTRHTVYELQPCRQCPSGSQWVKKEKGGDTPIYGLKRRVNIKQTDIIPETEYDQMPVIETLYAQPYQGSEKTIVEQQQIPATTKITSSISSKTVSKPVKKLPTRKKSIKPTKPKKSITTTTKTTSKKVTPPQASSKKYKIYYDPDGKEIKREIVNEKIGGLLKYISK